MCYLISSCPLNLGLKVLHSLMEASVAAQLRLHSGQVRAPLCCFNPALVLFYPRQQILGVAQSDLVQLRPHFCTGLLGRNQRCLGRQSSCFQPQIIVAAEVHQTLMQAVNPVKKNRIYAPLHYVKERYQIKNK